MPGGVRTEIHLGGEETAGAFCLVVDEPPVGWSLPGHRHANEDETIYVVDGEFEMELGGERAQISAGQTIHIPKGVVHAGGNIGSQTGRRVVLFSPAGLEDFFSEVGSTTPEQEFDIAEAAASAARHGWQFVTAGRDR